MTSDTARSMLSDIGLALDLPSESMERVEFIGDESLPSCFAVTDLAVASIGAANLALSELLGRVGRAPNVTVDRRLSSLWFGFSIQPQGWQIPPVWDPIAGDYRTSDGWIKLHTNAPHHKAAALRVLDCEAEKAVVANAVAAWRGDELETAIVHEGGCAAALKSEAQWEMHPQGAAVSNEPLVISEHVKEVKNEKWSPSAKRPLHGLKVLDLTRVLAGPIATRFLAGYGADVLRIDPPDWDEPNVVPEVTLGKRCARLDLHDSADRQTFERLLSDADIFVHGYRADALGRLGYDATARQAIRPGLIDVSLNAYGHSGPWAGRRGYDSLVQLSSGIADRGMKWRVSDVPVSLPVQALDHATGYLIAAAVVRAVIDRLDGGDLLRARLSLARTSALLRSYPSGRFDGSFEPVSENDIENQIEHTPWGSAKRVRFPTEIVGVANQWERPATKLGSDLAVWAV
ncbi:MAG: CoA transferase [Polyangiales bacterium]